MTELIPRLARDTGLIPIDFDAYSFEGAPTSIDPYRYDEKLRAIYRKTGYVYGPFRHPNQGIPDLLEFKTILMLRDPRDVLVSLFYSVAYSHTLPAGNPEQASELLMRRKNALELEIDAFVLDQLPIYKERYEMYLRDLHGRPRTLLLTYEEMMADREAWFERLISFAGFTPSSETLEFARAASEGETGGEDAHRHRRQGLPGDHRRKLRAETIETLNRELGEILKVLNYPV